MWKELRRHAIFLNFQNLILVLFELLPLPSRLSELSFCNFLPHLSVYLSLLPSERGDLELLI